MKNTKLKTLIGLVTSTITLLIICVWSYWGVNEAFHEGWYFTSIWQNIKLTLVQYLSIPIILIITSATALNFQKIGSVLFLLLGIFALSFFNSNAGRILIFVPAVLIALGFYFAKFTHKKVVFATIIALPLFIMLAFGTPQLIKVESRLNDNNFGLRTVTGNDVKLTWAPQGIGFPLEGTNGLTAKNNCDRLNQPGTELKNNDVNIWRLPTKDEVVRSLTKNNINVGGYINKSGNAQYEVTPDKETPLWNPHSKIIYYWTSDSFNENQAYLVAYNGSVLIRNKNSGANYQGYRCVKQ